jgi:hypothetical protein
MAIRLAMNITDADRQGPTHNVSYNNLLRRWAVSPCQPVEPECENCGGDMTGQQVYETRYNWVCGTCIAANDSGDWSIPVDDW